MRLSIIFFIALFINSFSINGDTPNRASSYPYISGDTFRAFADVIIDETTASVSVDAIKKGDVIFVKTDYVNFFFSEIHPRLPFPYILLTHNSDLPVPGNFAHYLDDPKFGAWFGQNIDRHHPKLFPIPIGIANSHWPHGNTTTIAEAQKRIFTDTKNIVLYINYSLSTNFGERERALSYVNKFPFTFVSPQKSFSEYICDLVHSILVLSPPGNGVDCHRTWEALYFGAIPIVKNNAITDLYKDLPVIIVNDWNEISEQMLLRKYQEIASKSYNYQKIYADYWFDQIRRAQSLILSQE